MNLRGIICDFDGTLVDTLPVCCTAFRRAFAQFTGKQFTDEEICACFGPSEEGIIQQVVPHRAAEGLESYLSEYRAAHRLCGEFAGMRDTLVWLQQRGLRLAIVSGKGPRSMAISLAQTGLGTYFDQIVTGSVHGADKPDGIRRVLQQWGLAPGQAAYIGDAPYDIIAAREAGVVALGAAWAAAGNVHTLVGLGAAAVFYSVADFRQWLAEHVAKTDCLVREG